MLNGRYIIIDAPSSITCLRADIIVARVRRSLSRDEGPVLKSRLKKRGLGFCGVPAPSV
jgi:hypothetical protein